MSPDTSTADKNTADTVFKRGMMIQPAEERLARGEYERLVDLDGHEQVLFCEDPASGLRAVIAVHRTTLGPSLGGCRMWAYENELSAVVDALRLSRGMSYKHALAGTGRGGGKAVILADADSTDPACRMARLKAFGHFVNAFDGSYITAEDVGVGAWDIMTVSEVTDHVAGLPTDHGGSGDPSPYTAWGVYCGIVASLDWRNGVKRELIESVVNLEGVTVAVQGLGRVGSWLCKYLSDSGARLIVADVNEDRVIDAVDTYGAMSVNVEDIGTCKADVFAPCALGGVLNEGSINALRASIVAGAANNQLAAEEDAGRLLARGILYAPDYVINAGGVINIAHEGADYDASTARRRVACIYETLGAIFHSSVKSGVNTAEVAGELAQGRLRQDKFMLRIDS